MKPMHWSAAATAAMLLGGTLCAGAQAIEGFLPPAKKELVSQGSYNENCAGSWQVTNILRLFNQWEKVKIGIDSRISVGKSLIDFKVENSSPLDSVEKLAKKLNANVYVLRDFLYIATDLPLGVEVSLGNGKTAPPAPKAGKQDPPPPQPPQPPPPPPGGKQPPPKGPQKPATPPVKPAAAPDKPPGPLAPITPDSGLSELTAIFPGLRPGTSPKIGWSHKSLKDAVADGRPIVLLAYFYPVDLKNPTPDEKTLQTRFDKEAKDTANFLETLVLEDPEVLTELKGKFNFILIPWNEPADSWPAVYTDASKKQGGALFLISADGKAPVLDWQQRNPAYTPKELLKAAHALLGAPAKPVKAEPAKPEVANIDPKKKSNPANAVDPADPAAQIKEMMKKDPPKAANPGDKVKEE